MSSSNSVPAATTGNASPPKVLVIGFGALGGLYSWILSKGGAQIYAVARSNAQSLRTNGLKIESGAYGIEPKFKPYKVFSSPEEISEHEPYDYILCTMKIVPEEEKTGHLLYKMLKGKGIHSSLPRSKKPTIIFVENGIGIEEEPLETLCKGEDAIAGTIISCCAWLGANLVDGGKVVSHGNFERLEMGLYPPPNARGNDEASKEELAWQMEKLKVFSETYTRGGGKSMLIQGDIQPNRWKKVLWNAAWGGISTLARQPVSVMLEDENLAYTASVCRKIMLEVVYTARACGYDEKALPASSIDEVFNLTYSQAPSILPKGSQPNLGKDFKPSLLVDLEANRGMELSPIIENVVKKAKLHNVETPRLEVILAALRPSLMNVVKAKKADDVKV